MLPESREEEEDEVRRIVYGYLMSEGAYVEMGGFEGVERRVVEMARERWMESEKEKEGEGEEETEK